MDDNRYDAKLDKLSDKLDEIHVLVAGNIEIVKSHDKDLAKHDAEIATLHKELAPIKSKMEQVSGVAKFFGAVGLVVGIIEGAVRIMR